MSANEVLMPEESFEEEWEVIVSTKGRYILSKNQARLVQNALAIGERGSIVFETFSIQLAYVAEFHRLRRFLKSTVQLPSVASEAPFIPISPEKMEKLRQEIYGKLGKRKK